MNDAQATAAKCTSDVVKGICLEGGAFWEVDIPNNHSTFNTALLKVPAILGVLMVIYRVGDNL
jgi:hypothetical protein